MRERARRELRLARVLQIPLPAVRELTVLEAQIWLEEIEAERREQRMAQTARKYGSR